MQNGSAAHHLTFQFLQPPQLFMLGGDLVQGWGHHLQNVTTEMGQQTSENAGHAHIPSNFTIPYVFLRIEYHRISIVIYGGVKPVKNKYLFETLSQI